MKTHISWLVVSTLTFLIGRFLAPLNTENYIERPVEIVKTMEVIVEKPVEIMKEVPKVVVRTIEVPGEIPEEYKKAMAFTRRVDAAKFVSGAESLAGVESVSVAIILSDEMKKIITESEIRTKFELTLRRAGVPISPDSEFTLFYHQQAFVLNNSSILACSVSTELAESVLAFRADETMVESRMAGWKRRQFGVFGVNT